MAAKLSPLGASPQGDAVDTADGCIEFSLHEQDKIVHAITNTTTNLKVCHPETRYSNSSFSTVDICVMAEPIAPMSGSSWLCVECNATYLCYSTKTFIRILSLYNENPETVEIPVDCRVVNLSLSKNRENHLLACLSNGTIALYKIAGQSWDIFFSLIFEDSPCINVFWHPAEHLVFFTVHSDKILAWNVAALKLMFDATTGLSKTKVVNDELIASYGCSMEYKVSQSKSAKERCKLRGISFWQSNNYIILAFQNSMLMIWSLKAESKSSVTCDFVGELLLRDQWGVVSISSINVLAEPPSQKRKARNFLLVGSSCNTVLKAYNLEHVKRSMYSEDVVSCLQKIVWPYTTVITEATFGRCSAQDEWFSQVSIDSTHEYVYWQLPLSKNQSTSVLCVLGTASTDAGGGKQSPIALTNARLLVMPDTLCFFPIYVTPMSRLLITVAIDGNERTAKKSPTSKKRVTIRFVHGKLASLLKLEDALDNVETASCTGTVASDKTTAAVEAREKASTTSASFTPTISSKPSLKVTPLPQMTATANNSDNKVVVPKIREYCPSVNQISASRIPTVSPPIKRMHTTHAEEGGGADISDAPPYATQLSAPVQGIRQSKPNRLDIKTGAPETPQFTDSLLQGKGVKGDTQNQKVPNIFRFSNNTNAAKTEEINPNLPTITGAVVSNDMRGITVNDKKAANTTDNSTGDDETSNMKLGDAISKLVGDVGTATTTTNDDSTNVTNPMKNPAIIVKNAAPAVVKAVETSPRSSKASEAVGSSKGEASAASEKISEEINASTTVEAERSEGIGSTNDTKGESSKAGKLFDKMKNLKVTKKETTKGEVENKIDVKKIAEKGTTVSTTTKKIATNPTTAFAYDASNNQTDILKAISTEVKAAVDKSALANKNVMSKEIEGLMNNMKKSMVAAVKENTPTLQIRRLEEQIAALKASVADIKVNQLVDQHIEPYVPGSENQQLLAVAEMKKNTDSINASLTASTAAMMKKHEEAMVQMKAETRKAIENNKLQMQAANEHFQQTLKEMISAEVRSQFMLSVVPAMKETLSVGLKGIQEFAQKVLTEKNTGESETKNTLTKELQEENQSMKNQITELQAAFSDKMLKMSSAVNTLSQNVQHISDKRQFEDRSLKSVKIEDGWNTMKEPVDKGYNTQQTANGSDAKKIDDLLKAEDYINALHYALSAEWRNHTVGHYVANVCKVIPCSAIMQSADKTDPLLCFAIAKNLLAGMLQKGKTPTAEEARHNNEWIKSCLSAAHWSQIKTNNTASLEVLGVMDANVDELAKLLFVAFSGSPLFPVLKNQLDSIKFQIRMLATRYESTVPKK